MADLIVSAGLTVLFEKLMSPELLNFATQEGVREKLKKWERTLKMIKALLADAEDKQLTTEAVKMWLEDLQDLAYDVEDILDEYATEALRRKLKIQEYQAASTSRARKLIPACCIGFTPRAFWSDFSMLSKIDAITSRLDDLYRQRTELGLAVNTAGGNIAGGRSPASSQRQTTSSLQSEREVYGRDEDIAEILKMVLTDEPGDDNNFGVISIVGMGGLGKTTLAQKVYNDKSLTGFNPKAWVCVSDDFDVMRISTAILESITRNPCNLKDLDAVQKQLEEKLSGRKFLIVLDDVWSENYNIWATLRSPFMVGAHGSKIIVTTRHESVALTMGHSTECHKLKKLSDDDCWSLFRKHAFDNRDMGAEVSELIHQKVIEKCNGLPLVAKTLGGLLRSEKRDKWLDILSSKLWELLDKSEIPAALQISYHHLPSHLKRCFAYCAILPKDYEFEETELVFLWMAEGLIQQSSKNEQLEDLGGEYFGALISRSVFQISSSNSSKYTMHDLVNDLAQKVSGKLCFKLEDEPESNNLLTSEKTRYASYICHEYSDKRRFQVFNDAVHLRTHLSVPQVNAWYETCYISNIVVSDLLSMFKKLRVLSLQNYYIIELPNSIEGLRLLRYLNLSGSKIRSLPKSVGSMCNLQTLLLRDCHALLKLPDNMGNLINLRHLDILGASLIEEMPFGVRKWECLRTLSNFIVGKGSGSNLKDLEDLKFLFGELHISRLENVTNFQDIGKAILSDKKDLKVLSLEWGSRSNESWDEEVDKKILDMVRPHQNLEKLKIKSYGGTKFSSWVGDNSFSKVTVLKLDGCMKCIVLPSLGLLSSLKNLTLEGMKGIKSIGFEFYGDGWSKPFLSLESLCFKDLEVWECWNPVKENESFPKLQELSIVNCPELSERLPNNLCSLKKLVISGCEQLVVSLSSIPMLCKLKIDKCKKIVCNSSAYCESLESVTLSNISDFSDWSRVEFKKVESLKIEGCKELIELWQNEIFLEKPPQGLHNLISLRELDFTNCNTLTTLLEGIKQKNTQVEELTIEGCHSLNFIFRGQLPPSLKKLRIENCEKLQCLLDDNEDTSTSLRRADDNEDTSTSHHLQDLYIRDCPSLTSIHQLPATLTSLTIWNCSKLTTLSSAGQLYVSLKSLRIVSCSELTALLPKGQLPETLETLYIHSCPKLESIVEKFHNNKALYDIRIFSCDNLKSFPEGLETLSSLRSIVMSNCKGLTSFPKGRFPDNLSSLSIYDCPNIRLSEEGLPTKLRALSIRDRRQYKALMELGLHNLTSLSYLYISGQRDGGSLQEEDMRITLPRSLTWMSIEDFPNLKCLSFMDFERLPSLEKLKISNCPELTSLPSLPPSLLQLHIWECPLLKEACKRDKGKEWSKIAEIPRIEIDGRFIYDPEETSEN